MSNNKQTMKLYTEEQVKHAIKMARSSHNIFTTPFMYDKDEIIEQFTPIELPSDEELKKQFDVDEFDPYDLAYLGGAIWMRDKIQGGNK